MSELEQLRADVAALKAKHDEYARSFATGEQLLRGLNASNEALRADNRHLREAMLSIVCRTSDPVAARIAPRPA